MVFTLVILFVVLGISYYIHKKLKKDKMVKKDYNRKFSDKELKTRNDLAVLRKELLKSDDPSLKNEILNKIDAIIKVENRKERE